MADTHGRKCDSCGATTGITRWLIRPQGEDSTRVHEERVRDECAACEGPLRERYNRGLPPHRVRTTGETRPRGVDSLRYLVRPDEGEET